jgi:hypothetical protein
MTTIARHGIRSQATEGHDATPQLCNVTSDGTEERAMRREGDTSALQMWKYCSR